MYGNITLTIHNSTLLIFPSESYLLIKPESYPIEGEILVNSFQPLIIADKKIIPIPSTNKTAESIKKEILRSDLMVAEISIPSFGLGYHVCLAKSYHIPILCLYQSKYKENISPTLKSMISNNFLLLEYNNQNLKETLSQGLGKLTPKKTRFNFNLSPKDFQYLNLLSREARKTKTEIIHDLITEKVNIEKP